jgi:hypothetical protein
MNKRLELFPYGLATGFAGERPVMLFRDEKQTRVLPVWVSPLEARVISSIRSPLDVAQSPHQPAIEMLKLLDWQLDACVFSELRGHHLFCRLSYVHGEAPAGEFEVRADNAMSLCLALEARFFADEDLIQACRQVQTDLSENSLLTGRSGGRREPGSRHRMMN